MTAGTNYQKDGLSKEILSALAENIDWPFKIIMKSADKKRKSTCEIKQIMKLACPSVTALKVIPPQKFVAHTLFANISPHKI